MPPDVGPIDKFIVLAAFVLWLAYGAQKLFVAWSNNVLSNQIGIFLFWILGAIVILAICTWNFFGKMFFSVENDRLRCECAIGNFVAYRYGDLNASDIRAFTVEEKTYKARGKSYTKFVILLDCFGEKKDLVRFNSKKNADEALQRLLSLFSVKKGEAKCRNRKRKRRGAGN
jgi:hypothetical protein